MSRVFALILVMGLLILSGCVVDTEVTPGAIAVWQQAEGNDWDIRYSLWDDAARNWYVPHGGTTELIAQLSGADHDPYIDSDGVDTAISVWSHEEGGSADIYYSVWKADAWSTPARVGSSLSGYDSDPAVAMDTKGNAVAVWVNKNSDGTTMLYYSTYNGQWSTPTPVTREQTTVSLPELSFSPTSGIYFLIWTEATSAGTRVFSCGYSGGTWAPPIIIPGQVKSAILDNKIPTDERIGLGTAGKKRETIAVWGTSNGELYSSTWTPSGWSKAVKYGEKKMPDAEYEYGGVPYSVFIKNDDLHWSKDLYSPNGITPVPGTKEDFRPALTFIGDRIVGLSVYWTQAAAPSEIYYARWTGSMWEQVAPIDPNTVPGQDRNPDVSPLQKEDQLWDFYFDWCGDGIIQWPNIWGQFEECEVGIPCANPLDFCNAQCLCIPDYGNKTWCGDGIIQSPNDAGVMEECEVGIACANPNDICNLATCKCEPQDQPPPEEPPEDGLPPGGDDGEPEDEPEDGLTEGVCGNGLIEGNEACDIGGATINGLTHGAAPETCPMGQHCRDCQCAQGIFTPRCGDGYISGQEQGANEECDTKGGTLPDTCIPPELCNAICRCEEPSEDDGMHLGCVEGACMVIEGEGFNDCIYDSDCKHYECQDEACILVYSPGNDECYDNEDCELTHTECIDEECVDVPGFGDSECNFDADCIGEEWHTECVEGQCVDVEGEGQWECIFDSDCYEETYEYCGDGIIQQHLDEECEENSDCSTEGVCSGCQCVYPPELDCQYICSQTSGADFIGQGLSSESSCSSAVQQAYASEECMTTCRYSWFYRVDNVAGYDSCCCGTVKRFECTNCPCYEPCEPECPGEEICDQNAPSWYSP